MDMQRAGAIAALFQALTYIVGFAVMATILNPGDVENWSAAQKLTFLLERRAAFQIWSIFIYVVFGILLVVLTLALHDRLKGPSMGLVDIASAFGLIWAGLVISSGMVASVGLDAVAALHTKDAAEAASAWASIGAVQDGLGGGVEIVGGIWVLLISVAALQRSDFSKLPNYIGILVGLAGILTLAPPLTDIGVVFGLGQIVWFVWIGILMFRRFPS